LKKFKAISIVLITTIFVCISLLVLISYVGTPKPAMVAENVPYVPEKFINVTNPDPAFLRAIANLGESISFNSLADTQVDNLISQQGTSFVEYQGNYYVIGIIIGEPLEIYFFMFWSAFIVLLISTGLFAALIALRIMRLKSKKTSFKEVKKNEDENCRKLGGFISPNSNINPVSSASLFINKH
jgi:hypothetical protein